MSTNPIESPDVIIAGAGIPGATLALALEAGGLKTVLIDPQPFAAQVAETFDGRASAISFAAFRQWRALGVAERLEPVAQPINQILVTDGRAAGASSTKAGSAFLRFDAEEIAERSGGEPLGYLIENRHIRAALAAQVEVVGIDVLSPAEVRTVERNGSARVTLADGALLAAPLIVGADGRNSLVRRQSEIDIIGWGYPQVAVVATVELERDHEGVAYEHFLPSGPFAILPLTGRRASLVWTESVARGAALKAARDEIFDLHLRRRFGDFLGVVKTVGTRFVYPLSLQMADRLTGPRVALVGDAGHSVHPIAGQGLNMGLKDVAALAEVLVEAIRLGEDIGSETVLGRYARWRGVDNLAVTLATDAFTRLFSNDNPLLRTARGLGLRVVNRVGPARRFFMAEAGGATGDMPRSMRGA